MNKEEILKMAQTENRGKDVADLDAQRRGAYFAYLIGVCLIVAVDIVEGIVLHRISFGCNMAMFVMAFVAFLTKDSAVDHAALRGVVMTENGLVLKNNLAAIRKEKKLSQAELAKIVGVSRNTISSIETGQFNPTAKLALILCIALDKKFEEIFYF